MSYSRLYATKDQRATFRRHFPMWVEVNLRAGATRVYLRFGNHVHVWILDALMSFYGGLHGSTFRGSNRRQRAASALGRRLG